MKKHKTKLRSTNLIVRAYLCESVDKNLLMKKACLILSVLVFVLAFSLSASFSQQTQKSAETPKFALLVGINKYQKDWQSLNGTHNDVELMKGLLKEFGFTEKLAKNSKKDDQCGKQNADSQLKTLCSEEAKRQAILDTFDQHLIENAKQYKEKNNLTPDKGAAIVFYYSGHGSFVPDDNGDEADGNDETLVPTDGDKKGNNHIRDDEFNKRIQILSQYTTNITFIIDSCHSGTATRGGGSKSGRVLSGGTRGGNEVLSDGMDAGDSYVTISGSLPNELAREDYYTDPQTKEEKLNGTLTYYFAFMLRQNPGATYRELMNLVQNAVVNIGMNQTPQAEGDIDRVVFGSTRSRGKVPIFPNCKKVRGKMQCAEIVKQKDDAGKDLEIHKIKMDAGKIVGARKGGAIVLYDPKARELDGDTEKIGVGTITSSDEFSSEAEVVLTDSIFKTVPENAKIVIVSPNFTDEKRKVAIDLSSSLTARGADSADEGVKNMNRLTEKLKDNSYLELVRVSNLLKTLDEASTAKGSIKKDWDIAVVRATYKDFKFGNEKAATRGSETPADGDEVYFLANRNGMPLYNFWIDADDPNAANELKEALELHVRIENLRNLGNQTSGLSKSLKINLIRIKERQVINVDEPLCKIIPLDEKENAKDQKGFLQLKENDLFYFQIKNTSDKDLYLYIYSLGTNGKIGLLYPPQGSKEILAKGNSIATHGANQCHVFTIVPDTPPGKETIKIIATTQPFPAELLTSPSIAKGSRSGGSPLERLLRQTATNQRGAGLAEFPVSSWAAINFDYEVVP